MRVLLAGVFGLAFALGVADVAAQDPPAEPAPLPAPPDMPPEQVRPGPPVGAAEGQGDLSRRVERSGGVIAPQADSGDPALVKPPPDQGAATTPVIPPPGTPENAPNVQPQ